MTKRISSLLIFGAALTFFLAFNASIPITDPVESNYALTAKEMVLSGDWLSPRIYGHYWFDKPIMIYWLIALSFKIFGITDFAARLPSAVFSAGSVAFVYWLGKRLFANTQPALLSAIVLATSLEFWVLAKMIITDAVLFFFTSVSLATLYLGLENRGGIWYVVAYAAAGLAVLTKGPVGIILPGIIILSYIALTRQWQLVKSLFPLTGLLVFFLIAGPWYYKMYQLHGQQFVETFLGLHNYVRATVSEHPKDNVFYYYLALFPISMLPWTGILFKYLSIFHKEQKTSNLMFLTIWPIIIIIFYTLMATKYPTYVFPASFPAALLIGHTLHKMQGMTSRNSWWWLSIPAMMLIGIISIAGRFILVANDWTLVYICAFASSMVILWIQIKGKVCHLPAVIATLTVIMSLLLINNGLVPLSESRSGKNIAGFLPTSGAVVSSYGDYSTSAVFYSGYTITSLVSEDKTLEQNSWSGKYTMPTTKIPVFIAETATNHQAYLLVNNKNNDRFTSEAFSHNFRPVVNYNEITLYQRVIKP